MQRLVWMLAMLVSTFTAYGDWTYVGRGNNGFTYVDYNSKIQQGDKITIWQLTDFESPIRGLGLSSKTQYLYDCRFRTIAGIYMISYRENMGEGQVNNSLSFPTLQPIPIIPDSPEQIIYQSICRTN